MACQFSSWYPAFRAHTIRATIIRPLEQDFLDYLKADGVVIPDDAGDSQKTYMSEEEGEDEDEDEDDSVPERKPRFAFADLNDQIRRAISLYGAVFPKLNWTSPRDAGWMLPSSAPLKCTSPADVYLLLKSSDFASHDLDSKSVFDGCVDVPEDTHYDVELILKKWYAIETSRELRCFVRNGISQRDTTFYEFLNEMATHDSIRSAVLDFWNENVRPTWTGSSSYVFDLLLTRDLARAHIVDFNPFAPRTDALLFTYSELRDIAVRGQDLPEFRVVSSRSHLAAGPQYAHNMMPREALALSSGRNTFEFREAWAEELSRAMQEQSDSDSDSDSGEDCARNLGSNTAVDSNLGSVTQELHTAGL